MPFPILAGDGNDQQRRSDFIRWTRDVLNLIVLGDTEHPAIAPELEEPMRSAWVEVRFFSSDFAALAADAGRMETALADAHGLRGAQLGFKIETIRYWTNRVNEQRNLGKWREFLRRLLVAIDTLLDSILKALGRGSAFKEIKDAIRDSIKDADDE